jgi:hypothetical protein
MQLLFSKAFLTNPADFMAETIQQSALRFLKQQAIPTPIGRLLETIAPQTEHGTRANRSTGKNRQRTPMMPDRDASHHP